MPIAFLLLSVIVPLLLACVPVAIEFLRARDPIAGPPRAWAAVAALGAAFLAGVVPIIGRWPEFPPVSAEEWLLSIALAAVVLALLDAVLPSRWWSALLVSIGMVALAYVITQGPLASASRRWGEGSTRLLWFAGVMAALVVPAVLVRSGTRAAPHGGSIFALGIVTAGTIACYVLAGSAKFAQLESLVGLGLLPLWLAAMVRRPWTLHFGFPVLFGLLHGTLWSYAAFYTEMPLSAAILGVLAPVSVAAARLPGVPKRISVTFGLQAGVALAMIGAAVILVAMNRPESADSPYDAAY